jgi:preprotein translocase subunit YajC
MPQPTLFLLSSAPASSWTAVQDPKGNYTDPPAPQGTAGTGTPGTPTGGGAPQAAPDGFSPMLLIGLFLVVMLFVTSRKDSKARKQQAELLASIKQGDRVVTHAGIHGVVHRLEEKTVTLLLDTAQVTFERAAIARVVRDDARTDAKSA